MAQPGPMTKDPSRHNHNPYAIAHTINSLHPDQDPNEPRSRKEDEESAAMQLYCCYQQLNAGNTLDPVTFHRRLQDPQDQLAQYPVLLHNLDCVPSASYLASYFAKQDKDGRAEDILNTMGKHLQYFDPPAAPPNQEDITAADAGRTKSQRRNRYVKERMDMSMTIFEFLDLFKTPRLSELFMAAHRWPDGTAQCPDCGSQQTRPFEYSMPPETPDPTLLSRHRTGPAIGWECLDCVEVFKVTTGTLMEEPDLPPADWLHFAFTLLYDRTGAWEHNLPLAVGSLNGIKVSQREAESMRDNILTVLPFARPNVRPHISQIDAIKMLAAAGTVPDEKAPEPVMS